DFSGVYLLVPLGLTMRERTIGVNSHQHIDSRKAGIPWVRLKKRKPSALIGLGAAGIIPVMQIKHKYKKRSRATISLDLFDFLHTPQHFRDMRSK
ncbi:MAG: hypothetical protein KDE53_03400, partial [Caldilineaceae bacterium]|nr:hypothetical protein [Caldilineaceae bacterium]